MSHFSESGKSFGEPEISAEESASTLWLSFAGAQGEKEFYQHWLALQSGKIGGVRRSLIVLKGTEKNLQPVAAWPEDIDDFSHLGELIEQAVAEQCGQLEELQSGNFGIAYPLLIDDALCGIVCCELTAQSDAELRTAMEQLQWGVGWLELLQRRKQLAKDQDIVERSKAAVDLLAVTLSQEEFSAAATVFTTELAIASRCERVSLGMMEKSGCKLKAVSFSAEVDQKMNLTRNLEEAMEEAILQRRAIFYPSDDSDILINRAHDALSRQQSMASIATFPLFFNDEYHGGVVCERAADKPFAEKESDFYRAIISLAGPVLAAKYSNDRPLAGKVLRAAQRALGKLVGRKHVGGKIVTALCATLVLFFSFTQGDYRLAADIVLEGAVRRAIVTPFDGFIDEALVRAGGEVRQGDVLCRLDDRDLRLLSLAKQSDFSKIQRQLQEAVARYDRALASVLSAQLQQAQAEIDLVQAKLERTQLIAPISGMLVSGDLSQRLGGSVKQGEVLFEITPIGEYRVILKVDERRIDDVKKGQQGVLVLSSQPENLYDFTVTEITPISTAEEGRNYFRVEASLDTTAESLRPGMEGVGKIFVDRRNLLAIWSRDLVEWWKVTLWLWLS